MHDLSVTPWLDVNIVRVEPVYAATDVAGINRVLGHTALALPLLEDAILQSHGRWTAFDVAHGILTNALTLWLAFKGDNVEAAAVSNFMQFPRMKVMGVPFLGGAGLKDWMPYQQLFVDWAKLNGCQEIDVCDTRSGAWLRVMGEPWKQAFISLRRPV